MITTSFVYAQLPRAGLGNKLLVWARGLVFSRINDLPFYTSSWSHFTVGPWLRREREKRIYRGYFTHEPLPLLTQMASTLFYKQIRNPPVEPLSIHSNYRKYTFDEVPHWSDYFGPTREFRNEIRESLWRLLTPEVRHQIEAQVPPVIAVHIRMGDFRSLVEGEDFSKVGAVRTPLNYFIELIKAIWLVRGSPLPVSIFSDGHDAELEPLLTLPNVQRAPHNPAIVDLWLMARSQLVIVSAGSTFGYWGGFLADAPILLHPDHVYQPLRPAEINQHFFEGGVHMPTADWPDLLRRNISAIRI